MAQAIFDPAAPLEEQLADSVSKGFLTAVNRDKILAADKWLNANWNGLAREFPSQAVSVVADPAMPSGFATYVGPSSYESENKARQFSPGEPYVTLEPGPVRQLPVSMRGLGAELEEWIREAAAKLEDAVKEIDTALQETGKEDGDDLMKKILEIFQKLRDEGKLTDDKLIEMWPAKLYTVASFVGGLISDGAKHENLKRYLIDTGASLSGISKENFEKLQKKGAQPKQDGEVEVQTAEGVKKFPKYTGLTMSFVRKNKAGKGELAKCDLPIIVTAADILGLDQLKKTGTKLVLDPAADSVELVER